MGKHIFIFAGSHKQAAEFARSKGLHQQHWTFINKPEQLRGLRGCWFIKYGTYYNHRFYSEILDMLIERDFKEASDVGVKHE